MSRKNIIFSLTLCIQCFFVHQLFGQTKESRHWEHAIRVGINVGGTTPIPLPAEIRKIESFTTGLNPILGVRSTRWFEPDGKWGITSGFTIEHKGMKESAQVKYWYTNLKVGEGDKRGEFEGTFSGFNETRIKNGYFTLPAMATYRLSSIWTFHAGGFFSWMHTSKFTGIADDGYIREGGPTGDIINVTSAEFDFSTDLNTIDAGLLVGADWKFTRKLSATGEFSWGFIPIFPSDFKGVTYKMYNLYLGLGLSYKLF